MSGEPAQRLSVRPIQLVSSIVRVPVARVMCRNPVCIPERLGIESIHAVLLARGVLGAPVVDSRGRLRGTIMVSDLLATPQAFVNGEARHLMKAIGFTLTEKVPIAVAAAVMAYEGLVLIPVVDASELVVGTVSSLDLLRWWAMAEDDLPDTASTFERGECATAIRPRAR